MQGQRSSIGALPENVFLDNGSLSVEPIVTTQMPWNSSGTSEQSWLGRTLPFNPNNFQYMQQSRHSEQNPGFSLSEPSSSYVLHQVEPSGRTPADPWNFSSQSVLSFENQQRLHPSNTLLLTNNNAELPSNSNQTANRRLILPNPVSNALPLDLNASLRSEENCYRQERQQAYTRASTEHMLSAPTSSNSLSLTSSECLHTSRKRKALELNIGQSSGEGSSSHFENGGRSQWQCPTSLSDRNITLPRHGVVIDNGSERASSRLRLGIREGISSSPLSLTASVNADSSRMNQHISVNGFPQQSLQPGNSSAYSNVGNAHASPSGSLGPVRSNRGLEVIPAPVVENTNLLGQIYSFHPPVQRNLSPSTWNSASTTRYGISSLSEESNPAMLEESAARNVQRNPMIHAAPEIRNLNQNPPSLNWVGRNVPTATRNLTSSRARSIQGLDSSETSQPQRSPPQYPQRLSEIARRSLLPSAVIESGGQGSRDTARSSSGVANLVQHARALVGRRLNSANAMPERFRRILEAMRRGEALRYEDVMFLEHSFLAMADMHDRHRDMRMDVDNMSYEELLALEERIGNVCTGLSAEVIEKHMKQRTYVDDKARDQNEREPCSICREEYNEGEDLGTLECGHDFHRDCIKQWLMQKNLCPICKTTGLNI